MKVRASELSDEQWERVAGLGAEEVETPRFFDSHRWHSRATCPQAGRCEEIETTLRALADDLCCPCVDVNALSDAEHGVLNAVKDLDTLERDEGMLDFLERFSEDFTYSRAMLVFSSWGSVKGVLQGLGLLEYPFQAREHIHERATLLEARARALLQSEESRRGLCDHLRSSLDEEECTAFVRLGSGSGALVMYQTAFSTLSVEGKALVQGPPDVVLFLVSEGIGSVFHAPKASRAALETALELWSPGIGALQDAEVALDAAQRV